MARLNQSSGHNAAMKVLEKIKIGTRAPMSGQRSAPSLPVGGKRIHFLCESMDAIRARCRCITQSDIRFGDPANALRLVRQ